MARTAKRYKKKAEKKVLGISVCMAAIYARLSVDSDEKKSESIETQVTLIKEFIQKYNENPDREYEIAVYDIYSDLGKTGTNFDRPGCERMMNDVSYQDMIEKMKVIRRFYAEHWTECRKEVR